MKKIYNLAFLLSAFLCAGLVSGQVTENFDTNFGSGYGDYTGIGTTGEFDVTNSLSESSGNARSGRAVRFRNSSGPSLTYVGTDGNGKDGGIGIVSFWYRHWDGDGSTPSFQAEYSDDAGSSWANIGSETTVTSTTYSQFSEIVDVTGDDLLIRVRATNTSERIIIDDFEITNFSGTSVPLVGFDNTTSSQNETNSTFNINIPVSLSNYGGTQVDLSVSVTDGTAETVDYTLNTTSLSFSADGTQNVSLDIIPDAGFDNETIEITLAETSSTGALVSPSLHTVTVTDDETPANIEDFTNSNAGGSYSDDSFVGNNGITWTYVESRDENGDANGSGIDGNALMLRRSSDDSKVTSSIIPGGIGDFSVKLYKGFTGGGDRQVELFINGISQGTSVAFDNFSENVFSISGINIPGDFTLEIRNIQSRQVIVDDITWTNFTPQTNVWNGSTDTDWSNASNWDLGNVPTNIENIQIPGGPVNQPVISSTTGAVGLDLEVVTGATLTIENGGSLILNGASTGDVTYNIAIPDTNWHLIGAPVSGQDYDAAWITANNIASGTGSNRGVSTYINTTDGDGDWVYAQDGVTGTFVNTIGYSVLTNAAGDIALTGSLLTTDLAIPITESANFPEADNSFNLVGNPFAAYVSIDDFLTLSTNSAALEDVREAVYVWNGSSYLPLTTGFIHPGQGFFLSSAGASESVDVNENMLSHQTGVTFYSTPSNNSSIQLVMSVGNEARSTKVDFINGKTLGLDPRFDVATFGGQVAGLEIYTALVDGSYQDTNFAIQALPDTDLDSMVIPVGVTASAGETVSITANVSGLPIDINVYLEDRANGTFNLLGNGNSFDFTAAGDMTGFGRFYLHATTQTLSNEIISQNLDITVYQSDENTLSISGLNGSAASFQLFDLLGKRVISENLNENNTQATVDISNIKSGVYIAQLASGDEATSIKLIINK